MSNNKPQAEERLVKYISSTGIASRRAAGDLVKEGRIKVDNKVILQPGFRVTDSMTVTCDDKIIKPETKQLYIMLNKPRGYICTHDDPFAELKAIDLVNIKEDIRLFSAGRLDKESEGMIIFTNDGDFVEKLTHPRYEINKIYEVTTTQDFTDKAIEQMKSGIMDEGELLVAIDVEKIGNKRYHITLDEGKKREVRRITRAAGGSTITLKRIQIGLLELGNLPTGKFRYLTADEVAKMLER